MMKRIILMLILMLISFEDLEVYGKIKESNVDKILVKYSAWNQFSPVQIGREYFEDNWKSNGRQTQTINGDSVKILITKLNSLKFKNNLRINTNELLLNSNITPDGKFLFWIGKDENDISVQLVLYNKSGEKEIIWIGSLYTDIGKKRYKTSQELIDFITELFEPQPSLGDTTFSDEEVIGAIGVHEGTHITDKDSNRTTVPHPIDLEKLPMENEKQYIDELKTKSNDKK